MGKKSRSDRRHHHQRMIDKVKKFRFVQPEFYNGDETQRQKHIRQMAETRTPRSCHMCGNPRRMFNEKTMQEIRSMEKMNDEC